MKTLSRNNRSLRANWDKIGHRLVNLLSILPAEIKLEHIDGNVEPRCHRGAYLIKIGLKTGKLF